MEYYCKPSKFQANYFKLQNSPKHNLQFEIKKENKQGILKHIRSYNKIKKENSNTPSTIDSMK